jgi:3-oxoacyl-[acyl-carrier-protein] synthase-3
MAMEGKEVFRRAVRTTVESASNALERAKLTPDDIALFVPHQANLRIIEAVATRLGIPMERVAVVVDRMGNTSAASVPLALAEAADHGRLRPGDYVLMSGFGAGMAWASTIMRWAADAPSPTPPPATAQSAR